MRAGRIGWWIAFWPRRSACCPGGPSISHARSRFGNGSAAGAPARAAVPSAAAAAALGDVAGGCGDRVGDLAFALLVGLADLNYPRRSALGDCSLRQQRALHVRRL